MYTSNSQYLCHYGIPGMRWGHRNPQVTAAKESYKDSRRNLKRAYRSAPRFGFGIKGIAEVEKSQKEINKAAMDFLDKKAAYKMSKKDTEKGKLTVERRVYQKAMTRIGLPGSASDQSTGGMGKALAKHLESKKGKEYADSVIKKSQNQLVTGLVVSSAVLVGSMIAEAYLAGRN